MIYLGEVGETPIGHIWLAMDEFGLRAVAWAASLDDFMAQTLRRGAEDIVLSPDRTADAVNQVRAYLAGERRQFEIPIHWDILTPFRRRVLQSTFAIPYGETRTYGDLAAQIGNPRAARAVGGAQAANPMPLVIPCHRVVAAGHRLGGYGGGNGLAVKRWLLKMEGVDWV